MSALSGLLNSVLRRFGLFSWRSGLAMEHGMSNIIYKIYLKRVLPKRMPPLFEGQNPTSFQDDNGPIIVQITFENHMHNSIYIYISLSIYIPFK